MRLKKSTVLNNKNQERESDQNNLDMANRQYLAEEMAIRAKGINER